MLTNEYLGGVPDDARAMRGGSLSQGLLTEQNLRHIRSLDAMAKSRGQSLAQMAIAWVCVIPASPPR